jgi:hypothetical protein
MVPQAVGDVLDSISESPASEAPLVSQYGQVYVISLAPGGTKVLKSNSVFHFSRDGCHLHGLRITAEVVRPPPAPRKVSKRHVDIDLRQTG